MHNWSKQGTDETRSLSRRNAAYVLLPIIALAALWALLFLNDRNQVATPNEQRKAAVESANSGAIAAQLRTEPGVTTDRTLVNSVISFLVIDETGLSLREILCFYGLRHRREYREAEVRRIGITDNQGELEIDVNQLSEPRNGVLIFTKRDYIPEELILDRPLVGGRRYIVTLRRGQLLQVEVKDQLGKAIAGVDVCVSQTSLPGSLGLKSDGPVIPGGNNSSRIYRAVTDHRGNVELHGLANGNYEVRASKKGHVVIGGLKSQYLRIPSPRLAITMQELHVGLVGIEGDEVMTMNLQSPPRSISQPLMWREMERVKSVFKNRFPNALVCVAAPRQPAGSPLIATFSVFLRRHGWSHIKVKMIPFSDFRKPEVAKIESVGRPDIVGSIKLELYDSSNTRIEIDSLFLESGRRGGRDGGGSTNPPIRVKLKTFEDTVIPAGKYRIVSYDSILRRKLPRDIVEVAIGEKVTKKIVLGCALKNLHFSCKLPVGISISRSYLVITGTNMGIIDRLANGVPDTDLWLPAGQYNLFLRILGFRDVRRSFFIPAGGINDAIRVSVAPTLK